MEISLDTKVHEAFHDAIAALAEVMGKLVQLAKYFENIPQVDECAEVIKYRHVPHYEARKVLTQTFYVGFGRHHKPP